MIKRSQVQISAKATLQIFYSNDPFFYYHTDYSMKWKVYLYPAQLCIWIMNQWHSRLRLVQWFMSERFPYWYMYYSNSTQTGCHEKSDLVTAGYFTILKSLLYYYQVCREKDNKTAVRSKASFLSKVYIIIERL